VDFFTKIWGAYTFLTQCNNFNFIHILSCKGSKCCWNSNIYLSIVMELGGMNLKDYFEENDVIISTFELMHEEETSLSEKREEFLTNIFKCAAKALQQFHECKDFK